tara:strand:- start:2163 stop:2348 length:186 start_codon:yes stop_codon:yes gene_type:complete
MHRHVKAEDYNLGVTAERERIINLLQEELDRERLYGSNDDEDIGTLIGLDIAIDIVKGDQK